MTYIDNRVLSYDEAFSLREIGFILKAVKYVTEKYLEYEIFALEAK